MFNTPVSECKALVVDPLHQRFGEVADITMHDWLESGILYLEFADGTQDQFRDGWVEGDPFAQAVVFRKNETEKIAEARQRILEMRAQLLALQVIANRRAKNSSVHDRAKRLQQAAIHGLKLVPLP